MNAKPFFVGLCLIATETTGWASAAEVGEAQSLPQVQVVQYVFDCRVPRALPSQRVVGEWAGQHNFAQVYDTRQKLMALVGRACRQSGIEQVRLVSSLPAGSGHVGRELVRAKAPDR